MEATPYEISDMEREEMIESLLRNVRMTAESVGETEEIIERSVERERDRLEDAPDEELRNMVAINLF